MIDITELWVLAYAVVATVFLLYFINLAYCQGKELQLMQSRIDNIERRFEGIRWATRDNPNPELLYFGKKLLAWLKNSERSQCYDCRVPLVFESVAEMERLEQLIKEYDK